MKRRIIGMILVVATLILTLAGCGYDYTKDDLGAYASYVDGMDEAKFIAALKALEIKDGDYGTPYDENGDANPKREKKLLEKIYTTLVGKVDTKDEDLKKTEGNLDKNDLLYFCYYATYEKDGNTVIVYPSQMKVASASSIKLGSNELAEGLYENLAIKVIESMGEAGEIDFADLAYSIDASTSAKGEEGDVAYVTYTKTEGSTQTVVNYEKVTLSAESENPVAKKLVGKNVGTVESEWTEGEGESAVKYTSAKILWVVEDEGTEYTVTYTLEDKISTKDLAVGTTSIDIEKDTVLTYHVYPVYYYEVAEFSAEEVLKTLITSLTKDSLECLDECEELINTFKEKVTALTNAEKAYDEAVTAQKKAETALETAEAAARTKGEADETVTDIDAYIAADATVIAAKSDLETKNAAVTEKETKKTEAETARDDAMKAIFTKVGAEDEAAGKAKIEEEYKETVKDTLVAEYNKDIKNKLAKAIWDLMKKSIKVSSYPKKAVNEVYDRMYESHEYTFYTESDSSTSESYYSIHGGSFKEYLTTKMGADSFKDAKAKLRTEAEAYVADVIVIYFIADVLDQTYTKSEIKEYKKDEDGDYSYNEYYQGESNTLVAYQFDKIMNYLLESTTDEETGDVTYTDRIHFYFEEDEDEHEGHDHD